MSEDLKAFGQKLRRLRQGAGLTQEALALKVPIDKDLLSKWERAFTHRGRRFKPDRHSVLRLIEIFANHLTRIDAQFWAREAGYELERAELDKIFPPLPVPRQIPPLPDCYVRRKELEQTILNKLQLKDSRTLVLIGPGGAGKTTLATWVANRPVDTFPDGVIWIETQTNETVSRAQEWIACSLGVILSGRSSAERAGELRSLLNKKKCLLVLDGIWAIPNLDHLRVVNNKSCLLVTTRDGKVPPLLGASPISVSGLTETEGRALLKNWAKYELKGSEPGEFIARLGGLPLALSLSGAQLQTGGELSDLLAHFRHEQADLSLLDLDNPQTRAESLTLCFDLSYHRLPPHMQQRFAQSGCFVGLFSQVVSAAVWGVDPPQARETLQRLQNLALIEGKKSQKVYWLHPLLRDYAQQQLSAQPEVERTTHRRHAAWFIRYALYHPAVLDDVTNPAPDLEENWSDVVTGVKWATTHAPHLATWAALLAHTERPALLAEVGLDLINAVTNYLSRDISKTERAILYELQGDLYLLLQAFEDSLTYFDQAKTLWQAETDGLAASRVALRLAGIYLLRQSQAAAAAAARQAQDLLAKNLPITPADLETARWLFYWFDMIYNPLVRWPALPEDDVANLARLAEQTNQAILAARGLHIYRLWCTTEARSQQPAIRERGCQLAIQAYKLWRSCGQYGRADDEICWSSYLLTGRYSQRAAARFARRLSDTTPRVNQDQARLAKNDGGISWWLGANDRQRVAWLSRMLPRYLGAKNAPAKALSPDSRAWRWVDNILNVGMLGSEGRRFLAGSDPPAGHILNGPEWRVLSGQKALPMVGPTAVQLIHRYLVELEQALS